MGEEDPGAALVLIILPQIPAHAQRAGNGENCGDWIEQTCVARCVPGLIDPAYRSKGRVGAKPTGRDGGVHYL